MKLVDDQDEIEVFPNSTYPGQNIKQRKRMTFDKVCNGESNQDDIYEGAGVNSMIQNVMNGFHSTIFCYGQTGSGKSYTMDGLKYRQNEKGVFIPITNKEDAANANVMPDDGLVQRCVKNLIRAIEPLKKNKKVSLNISFMQIYNEKIYDLLNPGMFKRVKGEALMQPVFHS